MATVNLLIYYVDWIDREASFYHEDCVGNISKCQVDAETENSKISDKTSKWEHITYCSLCQVFYALHC